MSRALPPTWGQFCHSTVPHEAPWQPRAHRHPSDRRNKARHDREKKQSRKTFPATSFHYKNMEVVLGRAKKEEDRHSAGDVTRKQLTTLKPTIRPRHPPSDQTYILPVEVRLPPKRRRAQVTSDAAATPERLGHAPAVATQRGGARRSRRRHGRRRGPATGQRAPARHGGGRPAARRGVCRPANRRGGVRQLTTAADHTTTTAASADLTKARTRRCGRCRRCHRRPR